MNKFHLRKKLKLAESKFKTLLKICRTKTTCVYNCTSADAYPCKYSDIRKVLMFLEDKFPLKQSLWIPWVISTQSKSLYWIGNWIFHYIPAYIIDFFAYFVTGKKL